MRKNQSIAQYDPKESTKNDNIFLIKKRQKTQKRRRRHFHENSCPTYSMYEEPKRGLPSFKRATEEKRRKPVSCKTRLPKPSFIKRAYNGVSHHNVLWHYSQKWDHLEFPVPEPTRKQAKCT